MIKFMVRILKNLRSFIRQWIRIIAKKERERERAFRSLLKTLHHNAHQHSAKRAQFRKFSTTYLLHGKKERFYLVSDFFILKFVAVAFQMCTSQYDMFMWCDVQFRGSRAYISFEFSLFFGVCRLVMIIYVLDGSTTTKCDDHITLNVIKCALHMFARCSALLFIRHCL